MNPEWLTKLMKNVYVYRIDEDRIIEAPVAKRGQDMYYKNQDKGYKKQIGRKK